MMPEDPRRQQYQDINRPGHHPPTPTSRPVIVGHRPTMPDPMISHRPVHQAPVHQEQVHQPASAPRPIVSVPIDGISAPPPPHHHNHPTAQQAYPEPDVLLHEAPLMPQHETSAHHHQMHHNLAEPLSAVGEQAKEVSNHIAKQRSKWWAPIVALVLLVILLYLLIDSGVIHTNINLPFHVFPQETPPVYTPTGQ